MTETFYSGPLRALRFLYMITTSNVDMINHMSAISFSLLPGQFFTAKFDAFRNC